MASRTSNSIKNISSGLGLKLILLVFQFATKTIFVRYMSDYIGLNALMTSIISYLNITELGISTAINFAMYKPIAKDDQEKVRQYLAYYRHIYHILGIAVFFIGIVLAFFIPYMLDVNDLTVGYKEIYVIYALYLINAVYPYFTYAYRGGFITASQEEYKLTPINYSATIGGILAQVAVLVVFRGTFLSFALYVALPIVLNIIRSLLNGYFAGKWHPYIKDDPSGKLSPAEIKELYKNTYGVAIARICTIINNSIDSIIISAFIGIQVLGQYALYNTLIGMVISLVSVLFSSILPSVGNLNASSTVEHKKKVFDMINFAAYWIYGFTAITYFIIVQPFMTIWAGEGRTMGLFIPFIVSLNYLTNGMASTVAIFREGCGLYYIGRYRPIFSTLANIGFSLLFASIFSRFFGGQFGVFGVILATVLSRMLVIWWYDALIVFKHVFSSSPLRYLGQYILRLLLIVAVCAALYYICQLFNGNIYIALLLRAVICLVVVNGLYFLTYRKTNEFQYMYLLLSKFVKRR